MAAAAAMCCRLPGPWREGPAPCAARGPGQAEAASRGRRRRRRGGAAQADARGPAEGGRGGAAACRALTQPGSRPRQGNPPAGDPVPSAGPVTCGDPVPSAGPVTPRTPRPIRGSYHPERPRRVRGSRHRRETSSSSAGRVTAGRPRSRPRESVRLRRSVLILQRWFPSSRGDTVPVRGSRHHRETLFPGADQAEEIRPHPRVPSSLGDPVPGSRVQSPRGDPDPSTGLITPRRPVPVPGSCQPEKTCPPSAGPVTPKRPRPREPVKLRRSVLIPPLRGSRHPEEPTSLGSHYPEKAARPDPEAETSMEERAQTAGAEQMEPAPKPAPRSPQTLCP
ncbi:proteoglycan 4-like [Meles meles]|uniref:proteoglycan 4-like n=1 Tax=Meles meles TaxID=9662 RepID=UPI001E699795|nr:proteoglycan 4-like [Meles meles]